MNRRKKSSVRLRRQHRGVGLIEVLVALVVVSVGVLAILGMQISGKQANYDAVQRTAAGHLAEDLMERMRANPMALSDYVTGNVLGGGTLAAPNPSCITSANPCSASQMVAADLYQWERTMDGQTEVRDGNQTGGLTNARACITGPPGGGAGAYVLTLVWRGTTEVQTLPLGVCDGGLDGTDLYGSTDDTDSDTYRRKSDFTFYITN